MKVSDLIEGEWAGSFEPKDRMRYIRKQRALLDHQRALLVQRIVSEFPGYGDRDDYGVWRVKELLANNFAQYGLLPEKYKEFVVRLGRIDARSDKLSKQEVTTKLNMQYFMHDPELALRHAIGVRKGAFPEGEAAIASNPKTAFEYATQVLNKRWPKGEPAIATDPDLKRLYVTKFGEIAGGT